ncbi:Tripartite ATP-independent periplasmic transporter solute receptor, DctP family [uncultured delta proteobacterium]|uniref:Tripartite ATP-independent periplasmic transporter solute receptor, DctP family n=1 Tax=uncultured delta proteobacterium TaxID=34034 RepID=A0A212K7P9_9DELT|nr:Tripartite ATP-independent periplasmic transporter solute receptor, DctP family [uncultured delta proteobacterium]
MKRTLLLFLSLALTMILFTGTGLCAQKPITLKLAHVLAVNGHYEAGAKKFAEIVKEMSGGSIIVETYPGGVLGSERDMIEGMQLGTLDLGMVSSAPLGGFLPEMMLFDLPFIFRDRPHAWGIADGPIGTELLQRLEKKKIVGLAYWENGFRMIFSTFPIKAPSDLKGRKIRVMENKVHMRAFEALGAIPTPMAYGELFTALQQKTIDGAENSIICLTTDKFQEVCGNLALTGHFWGVVPFLMSKTVHDKLTPEQRKIIKDAAIKARDWQRQYTVDNEGRYLEELKKFGMNITEVDRNAFREICAPIYKEFYGTIPQEMIEAVLK